ncbi:MAG: DoxX family protein [Acidobacteria bacterium]|nr:DoxX family protein [Acidobacteriota bacterium]
METAIQTLPITGKRLWAGHIITGLPILFLLVDGIMKLFKPAIVVNSTVELGYGEQVIVPLGIVLLASTILYVVPRTAVIGAILLTGYLGGAVATHVRVGSGSFPVLFPVIVGILVWGGLYLRDARIAELIPLRNPLSSE